MALPLVLQDEVIGGVVRTTFGQGDREEVANEIDQAIPAIRYDGNDDGQGCQCRL